MSLPPLRGKVSAQLTDEGNNHGNSNSNSNPSRYRGRNNPLPNKGT